MRIEILGCSGSVMPGYNTTSILMNRDTLIDVGSAASALDESAISSIRNILITHAHIDHIKELPFVLETLFSQNGDSVTVWGSRETVDALNRHVFNGVIWPEIRELNAQRNFVAIKEVPHGEFRLAGLTVEAFNVDHIHGSLCFLVSEESGKVLFSGDTGFDPVLFNMISSLNGKLKAFFVEVSFPNRMEDFARLTGHLTPLLLQNGLEKLDRQSIRIIAYHIKPKYIDEVVAELPAHVAYISGGEVFEF